jgi:hypothetical protein
MCAISNWSILISIIKTNRIISIKIREQSRNKAQIANRCYLNRPQLSGYSMRVFFAFSISSRMVL